MLSIKKIYDAIPEKYKITINDVEQDPSAPEKYTFNYTEQDHSIKFILYEPVLMEIAIGEFPSGNLELCFNYTDITDLEAGKIFIVKFIQFCSENKIIQRTSQTSNKISTYDKKLENVEQDAFKLNLPINDENKDLKSIINFLKKELGENSLKTENLLNILDNAIFDAKNIIIEEDITSMGVFYKIMRVQNLYDTNDIAKRIEEEKKAALESGNIFLTLKILSDGKNKPARKSSAKISFGIGLPSEGNPSKQISIENLENIIKEIRNIPSFDYIGDNIFFADGAVLTFYLNEQAADKEDQQVNKEGPVNVIPLNRINNIEDIIEIRYVSDEIGFSVFTKVDVPPNTVLGPYAGILGLPNTRRGYGLKDNTFPTLINSERYGNWAHLVNHSFKNTPPDIFLANIEEKWTSNQDGYHVPELVSNMTIPAGRELFFDYEQVYWNWVSRGLSLCQFKRDNSIVRVASGEAISFEISEKNMQIFKKYCVSSPVSSPGEIKKNIENSEDTISQIFVQKINNNSQQQPAITQNNNYSASMVISNTPQIEAKLAKAAAAYGAFKVGYQSVDKRSSFETSGVRLQAKNDYKALLKEKANMDPTSYKRVENRFEKLKDPENAFKMK
ncbi:MAG: SET domain-containing protein [Gammaproteobacteria bacterium]|nr:SET domain-containing protein [Gammaproteobacteria bacterium]